MENSFAEGPDCFKVTERRREGEVSLVADVPWAAKLVGAVSEKCVNALVCGPKRALRGVVTCFNGMVYDEASGVVPGPLEGGA